MVKIESCPCSSRLYIQTCIVAFDRLHYVLALLVVWSV
jgi:hypothetical protein